MPTPKSKSNGQAKGLAVTEKGKVTTPSTTRTASRPHPRLVNRGGAGLLHKLKKAGGELVPEEQPEEAKLTRAVARYRIAPALQGMAVPIDSLIPDPVNARTHPEKNVKAITASLEAYGQVKPIVVRRETNIIVAGNGTHMVAKALGWTEIAAVFIEMNEIEAIGYGLADNKTAELAQWDFEAVAILDKLLLEAGHETIGWDMHMLSVMRAAEWIKPEIVEGQDDEVEVSVKMRPEERDAFNGIATSIRSREGFEKATDGECLLTLCNEWTYLTQQWKESNRASTEDPTPTDPEPLHDPF